MMKRKVLDYTEKQFDFILLANMFQVETRLGYTVICSNINIHMLHYYKEKKCKF